MCVCVNRNFERRVGLFPAGLDKDGLLYCRLDFADYPITVPEGKFDPKEIGPRYMLLSYHKPVTVSSAIEGHPAELAVDESIRTWWCAQGCQGEWLQVDLQREYPVHSIQVNFADEGVPAMKMPPAQCAPEGVGGGRYVDSGTELHTRYLLEGSLDGQNWFPLDDRSKADTDLPHPYLVLPEQTRLRYVRLTGVERPYGSRLAVSGLRVFGMGDGEKPAAVEKVKAHRTDKGRSCDLSWQACPGAIGYNVRFGIAPDKLYNCCQVYGENHVRLITLNAGVPYWFAVDAFNESGITPGPVFAMDSRGQKGDTNG